MLTSITYTLSSDFCLCIPECKSQYQTPGSAVIGATASGRASCFAVNASGATLRIGHGAKKLGRGWTVFDRPPASKNYRWLPDPPLTRGVGNLEFIEGAIRTPRLSRLGSHSIRFHVAL